MVLLGKCFLVERGLFILFHMIVALYGMSTATGIDDFSLPCNLVDGRVCLWRSDKPHLFREKKMRDCERNNKVMGERLSRSALGSGRALHWTKTVDISNSVKIKRISRLPDLLSPE